MKKLVYVVFAILVIPLAGLAVARAALPATSCVVGQGQIEALKLEARYDDVTAALGCDGVLAEREDLGELRIETFRWRGASWPYAQFSGKFYNGVMHATEWRSIALEFKRPSETESEPAALGPQAQNGEPPSWL